MNKGKGIYPNAYSLLRVKTSHFLSVECSMVAMVFCNYLFFGPCFVIKLWQPNYNYSFLFHKAIAILCTCLCNFTLWVNIMCKEGSEFMEGVLLDNPKACHFSQIHVKQPHTGTSVVWSLGQISIYSKTLQVIIFTFYWIAHFSFGTWNDCNVQNTICKILLTIVV